MVSTPIPVQYIRQYNAALDQDSTFDTTAARLTYLTSPRRYAGQLVYDKQEDAYYFINAAANAYNPIVGSAGGIIQTVNLLASGGAQQTINILASTMVESIVLLSTADVTIGLGKTSGNTEVLDPTALNTGNDHCHTFAWGVYIKNAYTLYVSGITQDITLKIYKR